MAGAGTDRRGGGELTPRRQRIVAFIEESMRRRGYPPSLREMAEAAGLASASSVHYQLSKLEENGIVVREHGRPRTTMIRPGLVQDEPHGALTEDAGGREPMARVPLVGRIAAGTPITAAAIPEDVVTLPRFLVGQGDLIMLSVAGNSMTGAGIMDGDWVVVRCSPDAENGEIVAAMLDSDTADGAEATIKTLVKQDGHAWLMPHNPAFVPIPGDQAVIVGKVVAVLRRV